jgi:NADPH-dependent 2,4-dienoyl-CoA reductase/sulfur reductase-like enzyme
VAVAIGVQARKELAQVSGLHVERGIRVDECMRTSHPDIFAAGDVAEFFDPFTGRYSLNTLWGPARLQGTVAGRNMTGATDVYNNAIPFNVTRLAGLTTTIIGTVGRGEDDDLVGIARGDSETWRQLPDAIAAENHFEVNRLRVLVGERTLVGAVVMGDQTLSAALQELVAAQADILPIRPRLLQPDVPLGGLLLNFWQSWSQKHADLPARAAQQR